MEKREEGEASIRRTVESIDWIAYGGAVIAFMRAQEDSRRTGTPEQQNPATIEILAKENTVLEQLAVLLGLQDSREIRFHEKIAPDYAVGWIKALGVSLSASQEQELRDAALAYARARTDSSKTVAGANRLEKLAWDADQGLRWDDQVQKVLTPEQFQQYVQPGGSDPFWGRQAGRRDVRAESVDQAAGDVQQFWQGMFGLDVSAHPALADAAVEYALDVKRRTGIFMAQFTGSVPREQQMRFQIELLQLQAGAERDLGKRLALTPQQMERVRMGSGTVLVWR